MRGCWLLASSAMRSLRETLSTVTGLFDGWKPDSFSSLFIAWHPDTSASTATAMPARRRGRAGESVHPAEIRRVDREQFLSSGGAAKHRRLTQDVATLLLTKQESGPAPMVHLNK